MLRDSVCGLNTVYGINISKLCFSSSQVETSKLRVSLEMGNEISHWWSQLFFIFNINQKWTIGMFVILVLYLQMSSKLVI